MALLLILCVVLLFVSHLIALNTLRALGGLIVLS